MLILFETAGGYAIFKLLNEKKLQKTENLFQDFETPSGASKIVQMQCFKKFEDTTEAMLAATACIEGKMTKGLKKLLKKVVVKSQEQLAVADAKLGSVIKEKLNISCVSDSNIQELMRCIRNQMDNLITDLPPKEMSAVCLGLAHSLSRYKLKFSPDKIDTMIIQAVSLIDDLDKELNNYIMRCREWYGWHFPELGKTISDHNKYVRTLKLMGVRTNAATTDFSDILSEEEEHAVKELAEISMGTQISEDDIENISALCEQIIEMTNYRAQLMEYLQNRIFAIAPNLATLVGDLVAARLISHAGSLMNLAKHPASTVQILGAEKALFRALKKKQATPKYGLIYHAQIIGQTGTKLKGKMSRVLANKAALCTRYDALKETVEGEDDQKPIGIEFRAKVMGIVKSLEERSMRGISGSGKKKARFDKYQNRSQVFEHDVKKDVDISSVKREREEEEEPQEQPPAKKKKKSKSLPGTPAAAVKQEEEEASTSFSSEKKKKKKKKIKQEDDDE